MSESTVQSEKRTSKIATVSLYLGIGSLIALLTSLVLGVLVESIGIVSFFGVVSILALAAIVCGIIAQNKIDAEKLPGKRVAINGLIFGVVALLLTIFIRIAIFLFFIPWLGA